MLPDAPGMLQDAPKMLPGRSQDTPGHSRDAPRSQSGALGHLKTRSRRLQTHHWARQGSILVHFGSTRPTKTHHWSRQGSVLVHFDTSRPPRDRGHIQNHYEISIEISYQKDISQTFSIKAASFKSICGLWPRVQSSIYIYIYIYIYTYTYIYIYIY